MTPPLSAEEGSLAQVLGPGSAPKYPGGAAAYALANADGSLAAQVRSPFTVSPRMQWRHKHAMHTLFKQYLMQ